VNLSQDNPRLKHPRRGSTIDDRWMVFRMKRDRTKGVVSALRIFGGAPTTSSVSISQVPGSGTMEIGARFGSFR
jgi:hypothetical protein